MRDTTGEGISLVERTGPPRLIIGVCLLCAAVIGYMVVANVTMALGLMAATALFAVTVSRPLALLPAVLILSIFVEKALRPLTISVGGVELLNFNGVVNCCLLAATAFYVATGRIRPFQSLVSRPFSIYLAFVVLSLLFSVNPFLTIRSIVRISAAYCIYLIITQFVTDRRQMDRLLQLFVVISVIPITVGLYEIVFQNHFAVLRTQRIHGTFSNGMSYAMYLALVLPYVFAQIVVGKGGYARKLFLSAIFFAGMVNLVYTSTRIGWGVFAMGMILYAAFSNPKKLLPVVVVLLLLGVIVFFPFFAKSFGGYLKTDLRTYMSDDVAWDTRGADYVTASSLHIRVYIWRHMVEALRNVNVLFGAGSGTWFDYYDRKMMGFRLASHSDYFEVLYSTGLAGLAAYLVFRIRQLTLLARFARSGVDRQAKMTVLFPCLAAHIACLGMSITEVWQSYSGIYWISWITFAMSEGYYRLCCPGEDHSPSTAGRS